MLHSPARVAPVVVAVVVLSSLVPAPLVASAEPERHLRQTAQAEGGGGTQSLPPGRVTCEEAPAAFELLCAVHDLIIANYVDAVDGEDLASAAAEQVREADLAERTDGEPPVCPLPSPGFEEVCEAIDRAQDTAAAVEEAVRGMVGSLDPSSRYLTAGQYIRFRTRLENRGTSGLGVAFGLAENGRPCLTVTATCRPVISEVYAGSPAEKAGLMVGDELLQLGDRFPAELGCEAVSRLDRFDAGDEVSVTVRRDAILTVTIRAAQLAIPVARGMVVDGNIGYLSLDVFSSTADGAVAEALGELTNPPISGLVLDLRGNPGGYIDSAVGTAGAFLPDLSAIVHLLSRDRVETIRTRGRSISPDSTLLPMVIAVDGGSASASEMVTGALGDQGRVTVVGRTTFGKDTGQTSYHVGSAGTLAGVLQITTLRWFTPDSRSVAGGIEPHVTMDLPLCLLPAEVARRAVSVIRPRITGVAITSEPPDGTAYVAGETVMVAVTFDSPVVVFRNGGSPTLNIRVGDDRRIALYESGSGTRELAFAYTVKDRDADPDGISIAADSLQLGPAEIGLVAGLEAVLGHDALGADPQQMVAAGPVTPTRPDIFIDIRGSTHRTSIERVAAAGTMEACGTADGGDLFCPDVVVSRAQLAAFLSRALDLPTATRDFFVDDDGSVYEEAINRLAEAGITRGCDPGGGLFCPDVVVSRAQLATFLVRSLGLGAPT
ncbi:MAG: PDZ domain-containing protein [Acidimicrobiia bacterium]|nr:PDZ domain-containing protein [Acidimicrobiia bacterium]